jgi:hypothetical protein
VENSAEEVTGRGVFDGRRHGLEISPSSLFNETIADWNLIAGVDVGR